MMKAHIGSILLAFLAFAYVASAAPEMPLGSNLEEYREDKSPFTDDESASQEFMDEMEEQLQGGHLQEVEDQQASSNSRAVSHGSTIALQLLYDKRNYLGCASFPCVRAGCPRLYFEGNDWTRCAGEVFQIYRRSGPGSVKVGDTVGINYPHEHGRWFGCAGRLCQARADCPGIPSSAHGFNSPSLWNRCYGEVFKIYARGKNIGSPIYPHDHIMLYYVSGRNWVGLVDRNPEHRTCPGTTLPPSIDKYDACFGEVFELWERSN